MRADDRGRGGGRGEDWTKGRDGRRVEDHGAMTAPDQPALGIAVRTIREEKGLSQVALSRATGFRQSWVSDVENGRRHPSFASVVRLAAGLGVQTSTLVKCAEGLPGD
jgi:ribosome-binding protein aMBF1 (putative translation factor)